MSRRPTITRVFAAAFGFLAVLAVGVPTAYGKEFGSDPSATAELKCDAQNYFAYWYAHLANSASGASDAHFEVKVDALPVETYDVSPGTAVDPQFPALDGVPSHITIKADGNTLLDKVSTVKCRQPLATIEAKCDQQNPTLEYYFQTISNATVHFVLHKADGTDEPHDMHYDWTTVVEQLQEDQPYNVSVDADGVQIASRSGVADCKPDTPPTTTPPATKPPTTAPPATTPTTFVSVQSAAVVAPAASPTTTPAPAALPYTGSGSKVLALIAVAMLLAGGSTVIALRRRAHA